MQRISEKLYRWLLTIYPAEHRHEYGELMEQAFRDLYQEAVHQAGFWGVLRLWFSILMDTFTSAWMEHQANKKRKQMNPSSQHPVRRLLIPLGIFFFVLFMMNDGLMIYAIVLGTTIIGSILSRVGWIQPSAIRNSYLVGILLGIGLFLLQLATLAGMSGAYLLNIPQYWMLIPYMVIYGVVIIRTGRYIAPMKRGYYLLAGVSLALVFVGCFLTTPTLDEVFLRMAQFIGQYLGIMLATACAITLLRHHRLDSIMVFMLACGFGFIWIDPSYYTWHFSNAIEFWMLIIPLAFGPAWWLVAPSPRLKAGGIAVLWTFLMVVVWVMPSLVRAVIITPYGPISEPPFMGLQRILLGMPYLLSMFWLLWHGFKAQPASASAQAQVLDQNWIT